MNWMNQNFLLAVMLGALVASCGTDDPKKTGTTDEDTGTTVDAGPDTSDGSTTFCDNGVLDGDETDVDCGGSCDACALGSACVEATDCAQGTCLDGVCALAVGSECQADDECGSGRCEAVGEQQICTTDCTTTCPGQGLACFEGRCVPNTYCDDPDMDGLGSGPGCTGSPCQLCASDATCTQNLDVFVCTCNDGYTGDGMTCTDVDECSQDIELCDANATCTNTPGSYECACNVGYTGDGTSCGDVDECSLGTDTCDANATCTNVLGSFACDCNSGFSGSGMTCVDDNECTDGTNDCAAIAICTNTPGSFTCACPQGYSGDGVTCTDINECALGTDNCAANAACTNIPGGFTCGCPAGYTGDGVTCTDINECALNTDNCSVNATCTNTPGGFTCACNTGYSGNGTSCTDVNECTNGTNNCSPNATCTNNPGGFACSCRPGFTGNGVTCNDINECALNTDNCASNATCTNTPGSFTCTCPAGYSGNGVTCTDTDECALNTDNCDANAVCLNFPGGFSCACGTGYTGDGVTCTDINECALNTDNCDANADCQNVPGFYACSCKSGFTGNGFTCADVNECVLNTDNCDANAACTNTSGSFTCACNPGYTGDGVTCTKIGDTCGLPYNVGALPFTGSGNTDTSTNNYSFATNQCPGLTSGRGAGSDDAWIFVPQTTATYRIRVQSAFDAVLYVVSDCAAIGTSCLAAEDSGFSSSADTEEMDVVLTAGTTYTIIVDAYSSTGDGAYTIDVGLNECANGTDNCTGGAVCEKTYPGFACTCPSGYTLQGNSCVDINECATNTDNCDANAVCANTPGSFTCTCTAPFVGSGTQCWDGTVLGESCTNPFVIGAVPYNNTSTTAGAFSDLSYGANVCPGETSASGSNAPDQVYAFTPTIAGTYEFVVTPTGWDNAIYLVTDCGSVATSCVGAAENGLTSDAETLTATLAAGTTYYLVVDGWGTGTSNGTYSVDVTCTSCM
ncbi:MAG: EGF domain-containing protein [bacterium]